MTLVSELPDVIEEIQSKTELVNYGEIWRKFTQSRVPSPLTRLSINSRKNRRNVSLKPTRNTRFQHIESNINEDVGSEASYQSKMKTVCFIDHGEGPLPVQKEPIDDVFVQRSGLSQLFLPMKVNVYIPNRKSPLKIEVSQTTTFLQLITLCIKSCYSESSLIDDPEAYNIRVALKNGKPDESYPTFLSKTCGTIENFKQFENFVIIENPNYVPPSDPVPSNAKIHFQVFLPSGAYNILLVDSSTKLKKVIQSVCVKRQLTASNYIAMTVKKKKDGEEWVEVSGSKRICDLDYSEITLVQKNSHLSLESEEVWYPGFATQKKTYPNIVFLKQKKLMIKEELISLRIDAEYLTLIPIKKKSKRLQFPIENLVSVIQNENYPTRFVVEFTEKVLSFEASSSTICKEIIFKIQFLIDLERESLQTTPY